jgi:hypothetical protein
MRQPVYGFTYTLLADAPATPAASAVTMPPAASEPVPSLYQGNNDLLLFFDGTTAIFAILITENSIFQKKCPHLIEK